MTTAETKKIEKVTEGDLKADEASLDVFYRTRTAIEQSVNQNNHIWWFIRERMNIPTTETNNEAPFACRSITEALQYLEQYAADAKFGTTARAQKARYPKTCMAALLIANHLDVVAQLVAAKFDKPFEIIENKEVNERLASIAREVWTTHGDAIKNLLTN